MIEKLVKLKTDSISSELDSLCEVKKEDQFKILVDSIIDVRLADIKRKMGK